MTTATIVVNFRSSALLRENLVAASGGSDLVVVVDNRTDDDERAEVAELVAANGWIGVYPAQNTGFGGGMNAGVAAAIEAGATQLLLLNPDASIDPGTVAELHRRTAAAPALVLTPTVLRPDGSVWTAGSDLDLADGRNRARRRRAESSGRVFPWLSGACLALSVDLWGRIGGFDERYFLYWEDVDLCWRASAAGAELEVASDLAATHAEGGTQGDGGHRAGQAKSDGYYFWNIVNRSRFAALHLSPADRASWAAVTGPVSREILLQGGRRQLITRPMLPLVIRRAVRAARRIEAAGPIEPWGGPR